MIDYRSRVRRIFTYVVQVNPRPVIPHTSEIPFGFHQHLNKQTPVLVHTLDLIKLYGVSIDSSDLSPVAHIY